MALQSLAQMAHIMPVLNIPLKLGVYTAEAYWH